MCARAPPPRRNRRKSATWHFFRVAALKSIDRDIVYIATSGTWQWHATRGSGTAIILTPRFDTIGDPM